MKFCKNPASDIIFRGFRVMAQSSPFDVVAFDRFALRQDGLASAEVDVGGRCARV
jgi:hypothetical protein